MRILLAVLLCFVLLRTECFALHASNSDGGGSLIPVTGTYAGVMLPFDPTADPASIDLSFFTSANVLAVFTLTAPLSGFAKGDVLIFSDGRAFVGTLTAFADSSTGRIVGVLDADFNVNNTNNNSNVIVINFTLSSVKAAGRFAAAVVPPTNFISNSLASLIGKSHIDVTTTGDELVVNNPGPDGIPDSGDETSSFMTVLRTTPPGGFDLFVDGVKQTAF